MSYTNFKSRVLNHGYDHDGHYGWQCWDGFVEWCKENGIPQINTKPISQGGTGYVQDLWEFRKTNGMLKYFDEVEIMQQSDVAIFKKHLWTPSSHVAIFDSDIDGKYGYFLGQNQGSTITHPQGGSAFNLVKLPYEATYPTAFRIKPKKTTGGINVGHKTVNGDVYSDLITIARPELFWNGGSRPLSAIKYIVIHGTATTSVTGAYSTWLKSRNNMTSANYLVTPTETMGCVGENYVAWHSGGTGAITNYNSIGVEHINSSIGNINDASTYYFDTKTIDNGAKLVAEICKRLGIVPSAKTIVPHRAVSATACPQTLDMNDYIRRVQAYYNGTKAVSKSAPVRKVSTSSKYKVYRADDVKFVSGLWQIKCNDLTPTQFSWLENGIPVAMVNWVDKNGKNITDGKDNQFKKGMYFTFAGDEVNISDTGVGGYNYGYYWRKFTFGNFGAVWLSAWNKNHLVAGIK